MSGTDDEEKRSRGAGRSGTAGSIGKELGSDLDFEADALLDSLLSDEPPPPSQKSGAPAAPGKTEPPPSDGRVLHAPTAREFPDDEPTWVGNVDAIPGLDLQGLAAKAGLLEKPGVAVRPPPPPPAAGAPAIPVLPPPPAFSPPRPAGVPRPGGVSSAPRPGGVSSAPRPGSGAPTPVPRARERPVFGEEDEVTRVHGMATLHDINGLLERTAQESPPSIETTRPPPAVQDAHVLTSAQPLE
jgi:hypothetical protein